MENEIEIKLNRLLEYFLLNQDVDIDFQGHSGEIVTKLNFKNYDELVELAIILDEDKYITGSFPNYANKPNFDDYTKTISCAKITTKGRIFILKDGYVGQLEQKNRQAKEMKDIQQNAAGRDKKLFWLTVILAIGSFGLLLMEILKFWHHLHWE